MATREALAIKKQPRNMLVPPVYAQRVLREVRLLCAMDHPNVLRLQDAYVCDGDVYLVAPCYDGDLKNFLTGSMFEEPHIQFIMQQLFSALEVG